MPGGLASIVDAFGLGEFPQERMPQHMRRQRNFSFSGRWALAWAAIRRMMPAASRRESCLPVRAIKRTGESSRRAVSHSSRTWRASRCTGTNSRITPPLACTRVNPLPVYWSQVVLQMCCQRSGIFGKSMRFRHVSTHLVHY
jgi:hypothetical protein